jgi:hypothetical protein
VYRDIWRQGNAVFFEDLAEGLPETHAALSAAPPLSLLHQEVRSVSLMSGKERVTHLVSWLIEWPDKALIGRIPSRDTDSRSGRFRAKVDSLPGPLAAFYVRADGFGLRANYGAPDCDLPQPLDQWASALDHVKRLGGDGLAAMEQAEHVGLTDGQVVIRLREGGLVMADSQSSAPRLAVVYPGAPERDQRVDVPMLDAYMARALIGEWGHASWA